MTSRREFLGRGAAATAGLCLPLERLIEKMPMVSGRHVAQSASFLDIHRAPDVVTVQSDVGESRMLATGGRWESGDIRVQIAEVSDALRVQLSAPHTAVKRIHLRWRGNIDAVRLLMGDAWERGYGDLEWRAFVPDRVLPWYFATNDGELTHAYGVRTGTNAFCFWYADPDGISLWADVRSGGVGVQLGERTLDVCDVVCRAGRADESAFAATHSFCKQMCSSPRLPSHPVYGSNDWYWAYGKNSAASVLIDTQHIVELSPTGGNRPFVVIDDGWQPGRGADKAGAGIWDRGNEKFPDMQALANEVRQTGARPGVWIRPLQAPANVPDTWRLPREHNVLDPTVPEVLGKIADDIGRVRQWGFDLIKHDYSTFDIFGRWGFQMGSALTKEGWTFATGRSRTTAEVINELYRTIRTAAGESLVIGCNTVSHLSAGVFEICRIGDDTSGTEWARTRKMGVNTLAFRGAQHGAFYVADPDCVGVTNDIPWALNRQWLDLLAQSGTMLFVSLATDALGVEQRRDLRAALSLAAQAHSLGEPLDWQHTAWPSRWRLLDRERRFEWVSGDGVGPG